MKCKLISRATDAVISHISCVGAKFQHEGDGEMASGWFLRPGNSAVNAKETPENALIIQFAILIAGNEISRKERTGHLWPTARYPIVQNVVQTNGLMSKASAI